MSEGTTLAAETMGLVRPSSAGRVLTRMVFTGMIAVAFLLSVTPWQQTADGMGRVIAYAPDERKQNLEAPVEGRVLLWHVREGTLVKKGEKVVDLTDNDPEILSRLRAEREALGDRLEAARARLSSVDSRIDSLTDSRRNAISAADSRITMATQRVLAAEQARTLADASLETARLNVERQRILETKGLSSKRQVELAELEETRAKTEVERARVSLLSAKNEERAIEADRSKVSNDATAGINDARGTRATAEAEIANANAEIARLDVRLARQSTLSITAPRDGVIFRIIANGHSGDFVKAGETLAVLVPDTADRAVEVAIDGNDMPLVHEGSVVRVAFEGWPAVQFSGWPSVALGTFEGRVRVVDASDTGDGKFRILVTPPPDKPWPEGKYLRQGVRAHAWVQLGRVRLGYELWRQFNGFPPSLPAAPEKKSDDKGGAK